MPGVTEGEIDIMRRNKMLWRGDVSKKRRIFSLTSSAILILSILLVGISIQVPNAEALGHTVGNLDIESITAYGRILTPLTWGSLQSTNDPFTGIGFIGLVIDQANYNHPPGSEQVADSFETCPYGGQDDLQLVKNIAFVIDNPTTQKSVASFQNKASGTGDPNDILIDQTVWTVKDKDWAILQWTLNNLKSVPLNNVCIGLELPLSQVGAGMGLGGDSGDDIDGFDLVDNVYWAQDNGGSGTCLGFGSAIATDPITHYYSEDYHPADYDTYKVFWEDDAWLYNRIHASNSAVGGTPGNRTSTVGWNGETIGVGESRTFTLVIAANNTFANMITAIKDAQDYYHYKATGFLLSEFRDSGSGSAQIEVFNYGREPTDIGSVCSLSANFGPLTGNWNPTTIPTYGYSVFTPNEIINSEGDTIRLYENSVLIDEVSFGQEGVAPDPLNLESVARRYDAASASYTDEWLRNASAGPTWNAQNDVGSIISPLVVINRVMFNPIVLAESYVELMYTGMSAFYDLSNYRIVCDDAYIVPSGTSLNATNRFFVLPYSAFSQFFMSMDAPGDNVYLYDSDDNLLDMVGWSSSHDQGKFMSRMPDGIGTYQGYDDTTSQAAGWVFDQLPSLMITEFYVDSSSAQIELYNPRGGEKVLNAAPPHWTLESSVNGGTLTGSWNLGTIPADGGYDYFTLDPGGGTPGDEGDTIGLYYIGTELINEVSFGTFGVAPDPVATESTARYWDNNSLGYNNDWTREDTPTFGAQNDVPAINSSSFVIMNEVMFYPSVIPDGRYVVIINKQPGWVINVSNFYLVCDDVYQLPSYPVVPGGFDGRLGPYTMLIIRFGDDNPADVPFFTNMDPTGDNVYFYDPSGRLLDMVGWNTAHIQGMSARRVPDGFGTYQGYDDITSEAAGWVFNTPLQVFMTEISDSDSSPSRIEIYNPWYPSINFSVGHTFSSDSYTPLDGAWTTPIADSGGYALFDVDVATPLASEGDTISFYQNGILIEQIGYGLKGTVPDPLAGESVQRYWNGAWHTNVWSRNWTSGPNFGAQNDVPPANFSSVVVLNEIMFNPSAIEDYFIELYLKYGWLDISGYKIVGNSVYTIPPGTFLYPDEEFFYLLQKMRPNFFSALNPSGDNIYLYDNTGRLLDMAGWSSSHVPGETMCRIPNGNGTRDGFDDASSIAAGWVFGCAPTIRLIKVSVPRPDRPYKYGDLGDVLYFNLTITNKQSVDDNVLITNTTLNGYPVIILDETGTYVITEVFVPAGGSVNLKVMVILPSTIPFIKSDNITISIQSENTSLFRDSILLRAAIAPFIHPEKYASPNEIYVKGTGYDEISTITLNLTGMGSVMELKDPQDVVFCVDVSGSMSQASIDLAKEGLTGYVNEMDIPDTGAVVLFGLVVGGDPWGVELMNPLTDDYTQLKNDIGNIPPPQGNTPMGEALQIAIDELLANGTDGHIHVIILLTDGQSNGVVDPQAQADRAALENIMIFTIGLGSGVNEAVLQAIADTTGGQYFHVDDPNMLPMIYRIISAYIGDLAGRDPFPTDSIPMVRDIIPPGVEIVPGTFSIPPETDYFNESGYRILEWNITALGIGHSWEVSFDIRLSSIGLIEANNYTGSRVYYMDYFDIEHLVPFPRTMVNVLTPTPLPPNLYIDVGPNKDDIYLYWDEPPSPSTHHYLIYAAQDPTGFDFSSPWIDTSLDIDPLDPPASPPIGDRLSWNHTGAAVPSQERWYYCIRTVNDLGEISRTSRTVGKWTKAFSQGVSTFSLPLEPLQIMNTSVDYYLADMNARYIKWMDPSGHTWLKHGDGGDNDTQLEVGKGYEVYFDSSAKYTFLGMPGAMIRYNTGAFIGFDYDTNAKNLFVSDVNPVTGDVTLTWDPVLVGMDNNDDYYVYYSTTRDGFDGGEGSDYILLDIVGYNDPRVAIHSGALLLYPQLYYMVVPVNETGVQGASTYSIGVWTASYLEQYDTIGIPLMLANDETADWWCDNIPNTVGINFYDVSAQRWNWHSARMPSGAYDPTLVMAEGYQISTTGATKFIFIGR